jgi:L-fuculose-phosphate aldolase
MHKLSLHSQRQAEKIATICHRLHARNLLAAADGNVSLRLNKDQILITPSGVNKGFLDPRDISVITLENKILRGNPSGERLMHLAVYRHCPTAKAVVHAHPPTAIAWSLMTEGLTEIPAKSLSEVILAVGKIPIAPYARPGTPEMGEAILPFVRHHRALILARHGALSWGESLDEAYNGMERLEHSCQIIKAAKDLGELKDLPEDELQALYRLREKLGPRTL